MCYPHTSGDSGNTWAIGDIGSALASGDSGSALASSDIGSALASGDMGSTLASGNTGSALGLEGPIQVGTEVKLWFFSKIYLHVLGQVFEKLFY